MPRNKVKSLESEDLELETAAPVPDAEEVVYAEEAASAQEQVVYEADVPVPRAEAVVYADEPTAVVAPQPQVPPQASASEVKKTAEVPQAAPAAPVMSAPQAAPLAEARIEPDYEQRHMHRERDGYAGTFRLAPNEYIVSMYRLLKGSKKHVGGRAYLTNRRFLMEGGHHSELAVEKVQGATCGRSRYVRTVRLIIGLVLLLAGIAAAVLMFVPAVAEAIPFPDGFEWIKYVVVGLGAVLAIVGACLLPNTVVRRFTVSIFADDISMPICIRSGLTATDRDLYSSISYGRPGPDYKKFRQNFGERLLLVKDALAQNKTK